MNRLRLFFIKWNIKMKFKKLNPVSGFSIDNHGDMIQVSRIMYEEKCDASCDFQLISFFSGEPVGYPEKDENYRQRIIDCLQGR